jgi:hypothetical protein
VQRVGHERLARPFGERRGARGVRLREQEGELVAADTADQLAAAHEALQQVGHALQRRVADGCPELSLMALKWSTSRRTSERRRS